MASFDENGKYIKTNWKAGDKITSTKLNKIEESIEAVNDNDISRHVEADARLDALEAKDVAHDKELTKIKNDIADNKAAAELGDYDINSRMTFLENELNEGIEEVHNVAETVDGKIAKAESDMTNAVNTAQANMTTQVNTAKNEMAAQVNAAQAEMTIQVNMAKDDMRTQVNTAQANMTAQVNQGKADMEAMVAEVDGKIADVEGKIATAETNMTNATNAMTTQVNNAKTEMNTQVNNAKSQMTAQVNQGKADMEAMVAEVEGELGKKVNNFYGTNNVGKILMVGEDGYLVIDDAPAGAGGGSYPVVGTVDDDNVITLSSDELVDGLYTLRYSDGVDYKLIGTVLVGERKVTSISATKDQTLYEQGDSFNTDDIKVTAYYNDNTSEVVTQYTINSSSVNMSEGGTYQLVINYGGCSTNISIIVSANAIISGNLFVASTCTIGKRISSSGEVKDQASTFLTDYIEIGKVMATGSENIIHWSGFHLYKVTSSELAAAGVTSGDGSYKGVAYYDATGKYLGQDSLYVTDKAYDSEGNYQLILNATYSTATKIRVWGATLPFATSVNDLQNCKLTLNQLISEI